MAKVLDFFKKYSFVIKVLVSVSILLFVFGKVDFGLALDALMSVSLMNVIVLLALNFVSFLIMVEKWRVLLKNFVSISYDKLSSIYLASDFVNLFFLGSLGGEAYKVLHAKDKKAVFFTSVFDRLYSFKIYFLISCFILVFYFYPHLVFGVSVLFLFLLLGYYLYMPVVNYLISKKVFFMMKYAKLSMSSLLYHNVLSKVYLITYTFRVWYVFFIFGYGVDFFMLMVLSSVVVIAISIPISIQGFGVREWLFMSFALFVSMPVEVATAASILIYVIGLVYRLFGIIPFVLSRDV